MNLSCWRTNCNGFCFCLVQNPHTMTATKAYAAQAATTPLAPFSIDRREPGPHDVQIEILYCGVCHSDIHQVRNEWGGSIYPMVPGHEIVGRVTAVGGEVSAFKAGDLAGVGCFVDSCRSCVNCGQGLEQYCEEGMTGTYNSRERGTGAPTYGGYSKQIVVDEKYTLHISDKLPSRVLRRCFVRASLPIHPFATWVCAKGTGSVCLALVGSAIWQ